MTITQSRAFRRPPKRLATGLLVSSLCLFSGLTLAETYNLTVKVTVVKKTCDIYGNNGPNQPISVDFGDMIIKNIDGTHYETELPYTLNCEDAASNPALKLKLDGNGSPFNANLLKTSDNNVGLRLKAAGSNLNLGTWRNFTYATKPTLTITPMNSGTGGINDGTMTASATLSVEYQ